MFRRKLAAGLAIILALAGVSHASAQETATEPVVIGRVVDAEEVTPSQAYESISSKAVCRGLLHRMDALGLSFPSLGQIG